MGVCFESNAIAITTKKDLPVAKALSSHCLSMPVISIINTMLSFHVLLITLGCFSNVFCLFSYRLSPRTKSKFHRSKNLVFFTDISQYPEQCPCRVGVSGHFWVSECMEGPLGWQTAAGNVSVLFFPDHCLYLSAQPHCCLLKAHSCAGIISHPRKHYLSSRKFRGQSL